jgi:hypothetical protein
LLGTPSADRGALSLYDDEFDRSTAIPSKPAELNSTQTLTGQHSNNYFLLCILKEALLHRPAFARAKPFSEKTAVFAIPVLCALTVAGGTS